MCLSFMYFLLPVANCVGDAARVREGLRTGQVIWMRAARLVMRLAKREGLIRSLTPAGRRRDAPPSVGRCQRPRFEPLLSMLRGFELRTGQVIWMRAARLVIRLAEREGFEPSKVSRPCRFSRPVRSTAPPPLRRCDILNDSEGFRGHGDIWVTGHRAYGCPDRRATPGKICRPRCNRDACVKIHSSSRRQTISGLLPEGTV